MMMMEMMMRFSPTPLYISANEHLEETAIQHSCSAHAQLILCKRWLTGVHMLVMALIMFVDDYDVSYNANVANGNDKQGMCLACCISAPLTCWTIAQYHRTPPKNTPLTPICPFTVRPLSKMAHNHSVKASKCCCSHNNTINHGVSSAEGGKLWNEGSKSLKDALCRWFCRWPWFFTVNTTLTLNFYSCNFYSTVLRCRATFAISFLCFNFLV